MRAGLHNPAMLPMLATQRLRLEPITPADLDHVHGLPTLPDIRRYLCDDAVLDRPQVEELLREAAALAPRGLGLWSLFADDGAWIGILGSQPVSGAACAAYPAFDGAVEPVIALHPQAWGRGYAAEALNRAMTYARNDLHLNCLVALVDEPNAPSHRLLAQAGFRIVGVGEGPNHPLRAYSRTLPKRRLDSAGADG